MHADDAWEFSSQSNQRAFFRWESENDLSTKIKKNFLTLEILEYSVFSLNFYTKKRAWRRGYDIKCAIIVSVINSVYSSAMF